MTARRKLSASQALKWATAEVAVKQANAALDGLRAKRQELRDRYESRLEASTDPADKGKNVKVATAGGWHLRFTRFTGGRSFSLTEYEDAGHAITPEMAPHVKPGSAQVRVTVTRTAGPTKPGAVEPCG